MWTNRTWPKDYDIAQSKKHYCIIIYPRYVKQMQPDWFF